MIDKRQRQLELLTEALQDLGIPAGSAIRVTEYRGDYWVNVIDLTIAIGRKKDAGEQSKPIRRIPADG